MTWLSTGFALMAFLSAAAAGAGAFIALRSAVGVEEAQRALANAVRAVKGTTDRLSLLEARVNRLSGRVYSQQRRPPPGELPDGPSPDEPPPAEVSEPDPELAELLRLQTAPAVSPARG